MYWRERQITRAIQGYDPKLYAVKGYEDRIDIFRKTFRLEKYDMDGWTLIVPKDEPYRVISLTDTWNAWGKAVDWGIEPILAKLQACDLWKRDIAKDVNETNKKLEESKERSTRNNLESFLIDNRRKLAKSWNDINTSSLDKRVDRRYRDERNNKLKG